MPKIINITPFFIASGLVLVSVLEVLVKNINGFNYLINDSVLYGGGILLIVGISMLRKNNTWKYLFLFGLIAAFSPLISFSHHTITFSIGSLDINMIILLLLCFHLALNISDLKLPTASEKELELNKTNLTNRFIDKYNKKSIEELKMLEKNDLVPEAREALNEVINNKRDSIV